MTADNESPAQPAMGQAIADCLRSILKRCEDIGARLGYPGEGEERRFRGWLVSDLLVGLLGWPTDKVVSGEVFDLLLQDVDSFPIVYIETKAPYHKATKQERKDFEARLSAYGTLQVAYFTNGAEWERLDIFLTTSGVLKIHERHELHFETASSEEIETFFIPLFANRYLPGASRLSRHAVSRENPHILEALAADLGHAIGTLASFFRSFFAGLRDGRGGHQARDVALDLFSLWSGKSLIITPQTAAEQLVNGFKKESLEPRDIAKTIRDWGLSGTGAITAVEELSALPKKKRLDADAVAEAIWPAYQGAVETLCAQTAHVLLARALLYRIGEDQDLFRFVLSGEEMEQRLKARTSAILDTPSPAIDLLGRVRNSMERFLPAVYRLGEFDWWLITPEKRASLKNAERSWLRHMDDEFEQAAQRLLRMLNGYFFGRVDVDVWRNVYQHYLPPEERQRLGGFYTPDELVNLILDLSQYIPEAEGLCELSVIDPACGSGAFVTEALGRLLAHLELDLPCHERLHKRGQPVWKQAEQVLKIVTQRIHAVDLHPFAAFLTTLNVLFLLLPRYVRARERNPNFSLELQIFSADSLERPDAELLQQDLFARLNARVQLTEESYHRYQEMLQKCFDRVFGNPPWGGLLKGRLAQVYDTVKKQRFEREFPAAAQGKYDVYGLFMERALQILKPGGRFGLLTQGTFIDKEWARGLREQLATEACLHYIVDLNPFGQLFFRAMNTPCITVGDNKPAEKGTCSTVLSTPPISFKGLSRSERRKRVVSTIREALVKVSRRRKKAVVGFARAARIPRKQLRETAKDRWNLGGPSIEVKLPKDWIMVGDLLEMRQGVTPGGSLDLFLMTEEEAEQLEFEKALVHRAIKSREIERWRVTWRGRALLYPYEIRQGRALPAFTVELEEVEDQQMVKVMRKLGVADALDFQKQLDRREEEIVRRKGVNRLTVGELLRHRIALGLVQYPNVASYLVKHYERLEGRVFEKKRFTDMGKCWYEYHRPRDPQFMLARDRIVSPTLIRHVRFALDSVGYLSDHACLYLRPTVKTSRASSVLRKQLAEALGRTVQAGDVLKYCLAFLNSAYAQERLISGHRPTPKGSYAVTKAYLREIPVPPPLDKKTTAAILDLVDGLIAATDHQETADLETELAKIVDPILQLPS